MRKRPLCIFCVLFLAAQAVRALCFGAGAYTSALGQALEQKKEEIGVLLEGTVDTIEEKKSVTAVRLKKNAVSLLNHDYLQNFSQELSQKNQEKILVYLDKEAAEPVKIGNRLRIKGRASAFETARNPGNFDQRASYKRQRISACVWADESEIVSRKTERVRQYLHILRRNWKRLFTECLGEYYGNAMSAILLGEKSELDIDMKKSYQKNGIGHLLAISGLHMSFIGSGIYRIMRKSGLGFIFSGMAGGGVLLLYTIMTGGSVSSVRALIMFCVRMGAEAAGRDYDLPTSLALAAAWICAEDPFSLTNPGFLFSFGALCGICMLTPLLEHLFFCGGKQTEEKRGIGKKASLRKGLCGSLAVNLFLLGPTLYFYFEIPPYSVFLNLIVIPALSILMGAGMLGTAAILCIRPVGSVLLKAASMVLWLYDRLCEGVQKLPFGRIIAGKPSIELLAAYYVILIILWGMYCCFRKRIFGYLLLGLAALTVFFCKTGHETDGEIKVTVLDVGQGDGIVISAGKERFLIDGGSSDVGKVGAYRIEPYLLSEGADHLDYVFVTHGDEDHISGVRELLEGQKLGIRIDTLVLPPKEYQGEELEELARTAVENETRVIVMKAGAKICQNQNAEEKKEKTGGAIWKCVGPPSEGVPNQRKPKAGNEASLVLALSYGDFDMLFTGDTEGKGEDLLIESGVLRESEVLKCAHHGSKNSGADAFLDQVNPKAAVISAGVNNRYGHPHEETVKKLKDRNIKVYNTQIGGAVCIHSDGRKMRIDSFLLSN